MARIDELNQEEQVLVKNQVKYNLADMVVPVFEGRGFEVTDSHYEDESGHKLDTKETTENEKCAYVLENKNISNNKVSVRIMSVENAEEGLLPRDAQTIIRMEKENLKNGRFPMLLPTRDPSTRLLAVRSLGSVFIVQLEFTDDIMDPNFRESLITTFTDDIIRAFSDIDFDTASMETDELRRMIHGAIDEATGNK